MIQFILNIQEFNCSQTINNIWIRNDCYRISYICAIQMFCANYIVTIRIHFNFSALELSLFAFNWFLWSTVCFACGLEPFCFVLDLFVRFAFLHFVLRCVSCINQYKYTEPFVQPFVDTSESGNWSKGESAFLNNCTMYGSCLATLYIIRYSTCMRVAVK